MIRKEFESIQSRYLRGESTPQDIAALLGYVRELEAKATKLKKELKELEGVTEG